MANDSWPARRTPSRAYSCLPCLTRRDLLGDAVDVAAAEEDLSAGDGEDLAVGAVRYPRTHLLIPFAC